MGWDGSRRPKRRVEGLVWAELMDGREEPFRRAGGTVQQRKGLAFERRVQEALGRLYGPPAGRVLCNPWIAFEDANGPGWASPDIVLEGQGRRPLEGTAPRGSLAHPSSGPQAVVVECKLTRCAAAEEELVGLYGPLVEAIWGRPPLLIGACRHWAGMTAPLVSPTNLHTPLPSPNAAAAAAQTPTIPWLLLA